MEHSATALKSAIVIAATFVAEPAANSLLFWTKKLHVDAEIEFVSYNNVLQVLLDARSRFFSNQDGLNVVLLRFEDWSRFHEGLSTSDIKLRNQEFLKGLVSAAVTCSSPMLVCVCPPSPAALEYPGRRELFAELEGELASAIAGISALRHLSSQALSELFGGECYDPGADQLGHIPYTANAYAWLGTAIFRVFHSLQRPRCKVIVADCDNTLWKGVCGEDGAGSVEIDASSRFLQEFLKARQQEGILLCVCSKNTLEDVTAVFDTHSDMPLKWGDFVASRVNWHRKSENIGSLAQELSLGLNSFVFLDDNPAETAEVRSHCPDVQAITLPADRDHIPLFLRQLWIFDQFSITTEDRNRTDMYRQESLRRAAAESMSYADFLLRLNISIDIRELQGDAEADRAAQMTQRTNQFNLTTRRYTAAQMREVLNTPSVKVLAAFLSDRYGNYGQVGLMIYEAEGEALSINTFLLSCRALGKGVEHAMIAYLGEVALASSLAFVRIEYVATAKNLPALQFLKSINAAPPDGKAEVAFIEKMSSSVVANIRFLLLDPSPVPALENRPLPVKKIASAIDYGWIASVCLDVHSIVAEIDAAKRSSAIPIGNVLPTTELERTLKEIWERVLRVSPIGMHDNFFELGGDSLLAVLVIVGIHDGMGRDVPTSFLIEAPTIATLAQQLQYQASPTCGCVVPLKTSGTQPPFFCVHGVGGSVLELIDLAALMEDDQPIYGIQASGLVDPGPPIQMTVEEMCLRYIREMRAIQPEGPYYLGGSSFGGLVAYEMARQLTGSGQEVALAALFDTSVPGAINSHGVTGEWRHNFDSLLYRYGLHLGNLGVLNLKSRIEYVRAKVRQTIGRRELPEKIRDTQTALQWAADRYVPRDYSGTVTLFRATAQPPWILADPLLGWGPLATGGVEVYQTPGHHADLVRNPRAKVLALQLQQALAKARQKAIDRFIIQTD